MDKQKKNSLFILSIIFLLANIGLPFTRKIDTRTFLLSTAASTYFVKGIPDFDSKKPRSYLFPIVMIVLYIVYANFEFS